VEEVELLKDGTWCASIFSVYYSVTKFPPLSISRRIIQEEVMDLSDEDDDVVVASSSSKNVKKASVAVAPKEAAQKSPAQAPAKPVQDDIITLSDSDDDK
jgi:hypothetical protein